MSVTAALPSDPNGYRFSGPAGKLPAGRQVGSTDYATTHVEGPDAHDAASTAQPLQIGGVAESTTPAAVADGDAVKAFFDLLGQLSVTLRGTDGALLLPDRAAQADGVTTASLSRISSWLYAYNGSTWDRVRGDTTNGLDVDVTRLPAPLGTGIMVAATATETAAGTGDAQAVAAASNLRLVGFSCYETTGSAAATFHLRHGTSSAGAILATVTLGANESTREWYGESGIAAASGIWLDRISGNSAITVYTKAVA